MPKGMPIHEQEIFVGISEFETLRIFFGFVLFLFLFRISQIIRKRACSNGLLARNAYFNRIFYQGVQRATVKISLHASVFIYRAKILVLVNEVTIP